MSGEIIFQMAVMAVREKIMESKYRFNELYQEEIFDVFIPLFQLKLKKI